MMRGQSTIEYVLGLAVIILGLVVSLGSPRVLHAFGVIYHTIVQRVGADSIEGKNL